MTDVLNRHWETLRLIPRAPRKTTVDEVWRQLAASGWEVSKRTVERDLEKLSKSFPLVADDRDKPYGWQWLRDSRVFDVPAMDLPTALTFHFVEQFVQPLLPESVRAHLQPHLAMAVRVLDAAQSNKLRDWTEKVTVIPKGQELLAPAVAPGVTELVYEALLQERRLRIQYRPQRMKGEAREYTVSPLGLVLRDQVYYIVATLFEYQDIMQLALHRIDEAALLSDSVKRPKGFSLKRYVQNGEFDYPVGKPVRLSAAFDADAAFHLHETPLSDDQRIVKLDDGRERVTATVKDTQQLRWWLLSFGAKVMVEKPTALRRELASMVKSLGQRYAE